ncbi:hypothetical protein LPJ56_002945 [Coemansia sp. RSA 2599]|nr:hypothetical protein LPJ56_002945 [Coemansia sp. RSA 2599]
MKAGGGRLNSATNPALAFSGGQHKDHQSLATEAATTTAASAATAATLMLPESMVGNHQSCSTSETHQPQFYGMPHASSEYLMLSGDQIQFDFAGMAADHSLSFAESSERLEQRAVEKDVVPTSSTMSASSAAEFGLTLADYGLTLHQQKPPPPQQQQQQQRVARSQSSKKTNSHVPYNVDRAERRRGAAASTSSERGVDDNVYIDSPSRVATSFSSSSGQNADREASPSIPLILEQQCHGASLGCLGTATPMTLASSMLLSGVSAGAANGCSAFGDSSSGALKDTGGSLHGLDPLYSILTKALKDSSNSSSKSSNSSNSGDTVFKSESPDANRANDTAASSTPIEIDPFSGSDMFKFAMGGESENSDFNLLADLISTSSNGQSGSADDSPVARGSGSDKSGQLFNGGAISDHMTCADVLSLVRGAGGSVQISADSRVADVYLGSGGGGSANRFSNSSGADGFRSKQSPFFS